MADYLSCLKTRRGDPLKKTVLVASAILALSVMAAPVALAQDDSPSCAEAQLAFQRAQGAFEEAKSADKAAADAKAADEELERAKSARADANEDLRGARAALVARQAEHTSAVAEHGADSQQAKDAKVLVDRAQDEVDSAQETAAAARGRVAAAEEAAESNAAALQDVADKTDAEALGETRDEARKLADRICGGVTTTPTTPPADDDDDAPVFTDLDCRDFPLADDRTAQQVLDSTPGEDPHGLDADFDRNACEAGEDTAPDGSDIADTDEPVDVVTPSGGVATGGGPA